MPTYFQRPENALKRANEFIDVGKKQPALDALYDVIKSKKHRTWQKIHEPIMEKYLVLCVDLRKSHIAKEGLYQYKNICQQVNIRSLEDVVRSYLRLAEEKTEQAKEESHQKVDDIDDLDQITTPESLLLSAVSGEDTQDRTDRILLTPWVKFLWESYRQCLDLLRNNSKVERLYQDIAQQAFKFCLKYSRKTEFRKLCENLRNHLGLITKYQNQASSINLNNPDSQQMHLETRLVQLDSAISMELWQEAYKAIEDVHGLMTLSKKSPKPQLMANYYTKLGLVFWKSGNHLFHACALHRLLQLSREQRKNLSQDEIQKMASRVLLATLSIQVIQPRNEITTILDMEEAHIEKQRKLANLLGLQSPPNRSQLIKDMVKYNVIQHVLPQLKDLFNWLEVEFHPLQLSDRVTKVLEFIEETNELEMVQYVSALQNVALTRLLSQVSQVYQTIQFSRLSQLAPFASAFHLENVIVDAARSGALQVQIDHRNRSLRFGSDLGMSTLEPDEEVDEGPYLQAMPSDQIRNQLTKMSAALIKAVAYVSPSHKQSARADQRKQIVSSYMRNCKKEHSRILARRQIIEDRKEHLESLNTQREKQEQDLLEQQKRVAVEAEKRRLEKEAEEREHRRRKEEHKIIQQKQTLERIENLKKTAIGARTLKKLDLDELKEMDADEIMAKQVEQLEQEKKELQTRLKAQEKRIDYFARAQRLEEIPLLKKDYEEFALMDRETWDNEEEKRIQNLKEEREMSKLERNRLAFMAVDKDEFLNGLTQARMSVYKEKLENFKTMYEEERKVRLEERKDRRKEERRQKWLKEKEEEEQRKRDEEMKREREREEEEKRAKQEEEEEEYRDRLAKLEEQAAKQRAREKEIEERLARREMTSRDRSEPERRDAGWRHEERKDDDSGPWRAPVPSEPASDRPTRAWKPPSRDGGGWRAREMDRAGVQRRDARSPPFQDRPSLDDAPARDRLPARDERYSDIRREDGPWRGRDDLDRRGPPPEDRDKAWARKDDRDRSGPALDRESDWRRGPPPDDRDRRPPLDDRDRRGPPFDDRDRRGPDAWRRDDRGSPSRGPPPRDDRGPWRGSSRDDSGPAWRREERDRGPPVKEDRYIPPRGDEERDWRRDDRGPIRDDRDREPPNAWRRDRGPLVRGDRDRPPMRDDRDRPPIRDDRDRPPIRDDRDRPPIRDDRDRPPMRDDRDRPPLRGDRDIRGPPDDRWRDGPQRENEWRRGDDRPSDSRLPPRDKGPPPRSDRDEKWQRSREEPERNKEDDGWQTVSRR
ncbi:eukaryotic translation initiation factor 3 subunit A [Saccoglossus kowalevskii]|uniref:Eukaryotic translation initiation factor 3 subunit A n=1 Tax=Saccoglossus kowalevskii TaxID=10224 RepID=A0ABM0GVS0_SACKO|nr:PREDICTED: eukaryotic translation initiation factor 3 subunit A [Saccoglossus kowalevskii]